MPRIVAEIDADTKGFEHGLNRADILAEKFSHKFTHHLSRAFGIGFLATQATETIKEVFTNASEISKTADEMHRTVEEVQLLQSAAAELGMTLPDYLKKAKEEAKDLNEEIERGRKKGYHAASQQDVDLVKSGMGGVGGWKQDLLNRGITVLGGIGLMGAHPLMGFARGGVDILHGRFREAGGHIASGIIMGQLSALQAIGAATPGGFGEMLYRGANRLYQGPARQVGGGMGLTFPFADPRLMMGIMATKQLEDLKLQKRALQHPSTFSIWNPMLSEEQQGGAYAGKRAGIVLETKTDVTNDKLEQIEKAIEESNSILRNLHLGTP